MGINPQALDAIGYGPTQPSPLNRITTAATPTNDQSVTSATAHSQDAVDVDVIPSSPPPEVMDAIAAAADAYDKLASKGQYVSFGIDRPTGRVQIQLQDQDGRPISGLSPSAALRLAEGGSLD